ncbi:MAG: methyltransferase, TIGR04325 family [Nitrospinae bacterium]|nr:methyltransferase, TIGR04325 family [Nitrospinota bacterium]
MSNERGTHTDPKQQQSQPAGAKSFSVRTFFGHLARLTLPPFIYQALIRFRLRRILPFYPATYTGVYSSFKEMDDAFPSSDYYNDNSLNELIERRRRHILERVDEQDPNEKDRYNFLCTLVSVQPGRDVSILDVGAGLGEAFEYLKIGCPGKNLKYKVLEIEQVVELAKRTVEDPEIEFYADLNDLSRVDLVFFGSSFQYFENKFDFLRSILKLCPMVVAICDSRMGDMPTFVTAQVNMPNRKIPYVVNNRSSLVEFFLNQGYVLVTQFTNPRSDNFNNFPENIKNSVKSWSLVFKKVKL